jgi:MFS family permease
MAIVGWLMKGVPLLGAMLFFLFMLGLFSGCQRVAFQLLLSKVIPISRRGRLQAWRNVTGGLIAALLSYVAGRYLIGQHVWGNGYSTTFLAAFVLTSCGLAGLGLLLREPDPPVVRPKMGVAQRLRDVPTLLMGDRGFLFFMIAQTCSVAGRIAAPFYILFARSTLPLTGANIGLISLAYLGADTVTNVLWGYLGDKGGFRSTFVIALVSWIAATMLLMAAHSEAMILVAFFGLGAAQSGYNMSSQTMVLEFGLREDIAMRLAFSSTAEGIMATLGPLVGGLMAMTVGYTKLFWTSIGFEVIALIILLTVVEEPRNRKFTRTTATG